MSDNLKKTGSADDKRININHPHEVQYWTKTLGVTEAKLSVVFLLLNAARYSQIFRNPSQQSTAINGEVAESGRLRLIRNQVYPQGYRGFESLPLRKSEPQK